MTVDEALVEAVQTLGAETLSGVVNAALTAEVDRRTRAAALGRLLADWDDEFGPVPDHAAAAATAAFDDLDATADPAVPPGRPARGRRGAA